MSTLPLVEIEAAQRRTVAVLVAAQAVGAVGITIGIATASLLARDVSGSEEQAGLAQTFQVLGAAVAAYLLARLMSVRGRRVGLAVGYLVAAAGSLLAVAAGTVASMPLLLVGAALLGAGAAANSGARYAATDLATEAHRARALSTVVWATTIGAVVGPNLSGPSGALADALGIPELTGPFAVGTVGLLLAALVLAGWLRPDPLLLAREAAVLTPEEPASGAEAAVVHSASWRRTLAAVRARPVLGWAVVGLAGGHAAMVGVMIMTPLHMEHGGADLRVIGLVVSVHVLGMFAFSPLVGALTDRLGRSFVLGAGGVILLVSLVLCAASPEGSSARIFAGLFLLGLGWSGTTVAASTIIADHAPLEARTDVQGSADLVMGLTAAVAGGLAGLVTGALGYPVLALCTVALALLVVLAAFRARQVAGKPRDHVAELPS